MTFVETHYPGGGGATISTDNIYRYNLWRLWNPARLLWNFIMLNPSTADAREDDPTITRCIARAKAGGAGGILVTNLFAYRATDPEQMIRMSGIAGFDIVGPDNDQFLREAACGSSKIICGWGSNAGRAALHNHANDVTAMLHTYYRKKIHYLKLSSTGRPAHPLYLPYTLQPKFWRYPGLREENQ